MAIDAWDVEVTREERAVQVEWGKKMDRDVWNEEPSSPGWAQRRADFLMTP